MGKREKIAVLSLLLVALASLSWSLKNFYITRTTAAPAKGGEYSEGILGQPTYINPLLAHQESDLALTKLVFSGLYKFDNKGQLQPDLADGLPEISPDQKTYTINLKKDIKWHNDKPFNADDVVFTIQILKDPAYKSPLRNLWMSTSVEKLSDYSVKFTTKDVSGPFIYNLTLPMLPKAIWSRVEPQNFLLSKFNLEAVGTGPYSIKEIKKLPSGKIQQIALIPFSGYSQGQTKIGQVNIKFYDTEEDLRNAFHSREISGFGFIPLGDNLNIDAEQNNAQILKFPLPQYQVIFFNLNNKVLSDQSVRMALSLGLDKNQVIKNALKDSALPPLLPGNGYNLEQAKALLDTAGWKIDPKTNLRTKKSSVLELTLTTSDNLINSKASEEVLSQWQALNIKTNLKILPIKELTENVIQPRNFDILLFPLKFGADPDPFPFWHSSQAKDPGYNLTGFADQKADQLITDARTSTDQALREQKYQELNKLLADKVPAIFLDQAVYVYAIDKNIKNVSLQKIFEPSQRFYNLPEWYIKENRVWK